MQVRVRARRGTGDGTGTGTSAGARADLTPAGPGGARSAELSFEEIRDALADPARTFLRHTIGLRLVREDAPIEQTEPLWSDESRDRDIVDALARRLLAGETQEALLAELEPSPRIAAGAAGRDQARQLLAAARRLVDRFDSPETAGVAPQRLVSGFNLGMRSLVDAWLRHAQWALEDAGAAGTGPRTTLLITPNARVTITCADPARALREAAHWAARIRAEALPLFPATSLAYRERGDDVEAAEKKLFGDDAGFAEAEIDRPWNAALYRDDRPDLAQVLEFGGLVYGPILDDCAIDSKVGR